MEKQKICIVGGSLTGLATAISLSNINCEIDIITENKKEDPNTNRTIAVSESNLDFLKKLGIFKNNSKTYWPCSIMKLYTGVNNEKFSEIIEINKDKKKNNIFYILENLKLKMLMEKKVKNTKSITVRNNGRVSNIKNSGLLKSINLNKKDHKYNLIIICSGSNSELVKNLFNDQIIENSYNETSITTTLTHKFLRNNVARQIFLDKEILALLPISNTKTSVVWSVQKGLYKKNNDVIKKRISFYAKNYLKNIKLLNKIEHRDLKFLVRKKYYSDRILLFGDALHVVHPFAGQGFNMTLRDLSYLEKILFEKIELGLDIGSTDILSEFSKKIKPINFINSMGIDLIKKSFSIEEKPIKKVRNIILKNINKNKFIKDIFYDLANEGIKF